MKCTRLLPAVVWLLCLRAAALPVQDCPALEEVLELPPGVRVIAAHGYVASAANTDPRFQADDAAYAEAGTEATSLVLEVQGPRTVRLYHASGALDTGSYLWLRVDGKVERTFQSSLAASTDVTVPAGPHHVELIGELVAVAVYKVTDLAPGLPVLTQPDLALPVDDVVSLRLPVESDSPVAWSASGLPEGLTLDAATGRITGWVSGPAVSDRPVSAWVTMTNVHGPQSELLRIWWMESARSYNGETIAGRHARRPDARAFLQCLPAQPLTLPPVEKHLGLPVSLSDGSAVGDVVTTLTGPNTLRFRSRGSTAAPGPVVVSVDGEEVLRRVARATMDEEMSVEIPPGEHEVVWQFPPGGRLDRIHRDSDPIPQSMGPRLLGPFALTARPGVPFSFDLNAASPFGPGSFHGTTPPGVTLRQETGILSGTLSEGDYWIYVGVYQSDEMDTAFYHLQVREDASAVLNTPGLTWLQTAGPPPWHSVPAGPDGVAVWEFNSTGGLFEASRMETIIEGPDMLYCRFHPLGSGSLEIEVDGRVFRVRQPQPNWENFLNVPIPPGRHVLALKAMKAVLPGGVELQPLRLASAGAPVLTMPAVIHTDGTPVRIPLTATGGPVEGFAASGLPAGMSLSGGEISGSMGAQKSDSVLSVTRGGVTTAARMEWRISGINEELDSAGWYGYSDGSSNVSMELGEPWDGISALALFLRDEDGLHEAGVARILTGPDTLTFRRLSRNAVRLEVKVDGAVVHEELVHTEAWGAVSVAIPAGEHHVTVAALPARGEVYSDDRYYSGSYAELLLDDFRLATELRPAITEAARRLELLPGQNFSFRPQTEMKIREWSLPGVPEGMQFDARTGTLTAEPVTTPPGEYVLTFTATNLDGSDDILVVLAVAAPPALGDSPRLRLQKNRWFLEPEDPGAAAPPVDAGEVHYAVDNDLGIMSAWVDGPDTLQFWWRFNHGDTFFYVELDGEKIYAPNVRPFGYWERVEIAIPPGRHRVAWFGYDTVAVDHITLASDGVPQLLTAPEYVVDPEGFSIRLAARNTPVTWACEEFTISADGVITGTFDPDEPQFVHVSATSAAGTGYAQFRLRPQTLFNVVLDSPLLWHSETGDWWPEAPALGILPRPADDEDYLASSGSNSPLTVDIAPGGGLLALWVKATNDYRRLKVDGGPDFYWLPAFQYELPDDDWHRILVPLHDQAHVLHIYDQADGGDPGLWLDRAELIRPGDALIELCPLPTFLPGVPYTAQLQLLSGGPVTWNVTGLPAGLSLDSATGVISGIPISGQPESAELRITATSSDGRSTFAWMKLESLTALAEALDTHTIAWRVERVNPADGWQPGVVPGIQPDDIHPSHDGVDYVSCLVGYEGRATLSATVTGPGELSFWWSVPHADRPLFYVNGVVKAMAPHDHQLVPQRYAISLPAGTHELRWEATNADGSQDGIGFIDRVLWSRDAAPLFTADTFDLEIEPGAPFAYHIPTNGAPVFRGEDVPDWLTLDPATGMLSGQAAAEPGDGSFTVIITQDGREDRALFNVRIRPTAAAALDTAAGLWQRATISAWRTVNDPAVVRSGGGSVFALGQGTGGTEPLLFFVNGPGFVTWWSRLDGQGTLRVRPHHLHGAAMYERNGSGSWQRGLVAVPGSGRQTVAFEATTDGTLYLDTVQTFPWHADANADALSNSLAVALGRWPDAPSAGDPQFFIAQYPDVPGDALVSFASDDSGSLFAPTRDHAMSLRLEQSTALNIWQPAPATEFFPGEYLRRWRIPQPAGSREFLRVLAVPDPR